VFPFIGEAFELTDNRMMNLHRERAIQTLIDIGFANGEKVMENT
jgi:hypothetical protein